MKSLLVAMFFALLASNSVSAQSFGVDFKSMKRGTKIYYENSEGQKWVSTFAGKRGRFYRLDIQFIPDDRRARRREFFDTQGRLVRIEFPKRSTSNITFKPYHCGRQLGRCVMESTTNQVINLGGNRGAKLITRYRYDTKVTGQDYSSTYTSSKLGLNKKTFKAEVQTQTGRLTSKMTKYNLFANRTQKTGGKTRWTRIIRIED